MASSLPLLVLEGSAAADHALSSIRPILTKALDSSNASSTNGHHVQAAFHILERAATGLTRTTSVNASSILAMEQRHTIQVMATATSSVSIAAVLLALYWFFLMRRNFRRDLVLLLIIGDLWKSLWYWTYSVVAFTRGQVRSQSKFCQVSGFFLEQGLESCDIAILLMSLHMYFQIFPPTQSLLGHDGLYRLRHWVVAAWFLIPLTMASLAFINPAPGYEVVGAFCWLPIRPFWYRLALSWIPRYLVWIFVMGIAIRIYTHVGKEFRVFGYERDRSSSIAMPGASSVDRAATNDMMASRYRNSVVAVPAGQGEKRGALDEDIAPDEKGTRRRRSLALSQHSQLDAYPTLPDTPMRHASTPNWSTTFDFPNEVLTGPAPPTFSNPSSRRASRQIAVGIMAEDFAPSHDMASTSHLQGSVTTLDSTKSTLAPPPEIPPPLTLTPIRESEQGGVSTTSANSSTAQTAVARVLKTRRRAIQRQLRLLFIYPVVYMMVWVIPFVFHTMNYSDHFAQHPVYAISALNTFCQCFLGSVDVFVFCWREKPWRHIPGSDGTLLGSFCFWRFGLLPGWTQTSRRESHPREPIPAAVEDIAAEHENMQSRTGLLASLRRWSASLRGSSGRSSQASEGLAAAKPTTTTSTTTRASRPVGRRTLSGMSDRKQLESEQAHQRLAMERAEWEQNKKELHERRASVMMPAQGQALGGQTPTLERKEWWDRQTERDLFDDDDHDVDDHDDMHGPGAV